MTWWREVVSAVGWSGWMLLELALLAVWGAVIVAVSGLFRDSRRTGHLPGFALERAATSSIARVFFSGTRHG